ncbi:RND superfamily putative drug exporter [Nocardioides daedukensis]|uniref:RND superfamily putative drug exporter n=1 Tax=Nocardioides daedukensis TaxID=634462 RepID=A0A7Y9S2S9_9ACTN|nr:MMPL family transporter [Nocardioides daedukensis]NYG59477.1 RND superfamily putative drug exporter [Nocardioides daedukensis]
MLTNPRRSWAVVLLALIFAGLVFGVLGEGERTQKPTDDMPSGADSTLATELRDKLPEEDSSVAIALFTADEGKLDQAAIKDLAQGPPPQFSKDGTAAFAIVPVTGASATDVEAFVTDLRERLDKQVPEGVTAQVTGPAAIEADLAQVFQGANTRLLAVTASVVAILLVITYRSPFLWLVPLLVVGLADRLAALLATQVMATLGVAWNESTVGILSVLVFGAGTNYALLLISRYRDELKTHADRAEAMRLALRRTAEAVLTSAGTVVAGLLTLLLSLTPTTRGLGLACAVGIVVAATFVLVVLPATLVLFGRWIFWPIVPREGDAVLTETDSWWRKVGNTVAGRPAAFIVGALVVLGVMAAGLLQVDTGLRQSDQFLDRPESIAAGERLAESFPAGTSNPTQVLTRDNADDVVAAIKETSGVSSARPGTSAGGITQIDVVLDAAPSTDKAATAISDLRERLGDFKDTHVTGNAATEIDAQEGAERDQALILPLILLLVLGVLLVLLRSVVAPLLLVATVVGTFAAAMGSSWWLFTGVLGFDALDVDVPLFGFLFLVALGVDYNIFLVTRAREEALTHGTREGMLRALAATGGVITSAGILLAAVFAVLGVLPLVVLAQLGVVICIGVLLDTLLVRTVLVPALALQLGDRFWWPRKVTAKIAQEPVGN